jgi:hypothetical protein
MPGFFLIRMAHRAFWHYQHGPSLLALLCCCAVLQTISDMVIYNRSRRDARRRFKMRNMKERQMMKFKVGTAQRLLQHSMTTTFCQNHHCLIAHTIALAC